MTMATSTTSTEINTRRDKKMEENDGLRTVQSLRGRLLAERQASRSAKEEAEIMGSKLKELENKLREEMKFRNKAERRLMRLREKLESLRILPVSEESGQSNSSENCSFSCGSSTCSSGSKASEESHSKSQNITPEISEKTQEIKESKVTSSIQSLNNSFKAETPSSPATSKSSTIHEESKTDDKSFSSLKSSAGQTSSESEGNVSSYTDDYVDNSLALVPVNPPSEPTAETKTKIASRSVGEILDELNLARERVQKSMESSRHLIRVGPS